MTKRQSNPPPPAGAVKPPPPADPPRTFVPVQYPDGSYGRALPILANHDPAAFVGAFWFRGGQAFATFKPGAVPLKAVAELGGGWRVLEAEERDGEAYALKAELLLLSTVTVSHNQAREGSQLMATKNEVQLGDRVKDRVTGFTGIVVARSEYLHGCRRVGVQSEKLEDGKPKDAQWFDEPQVEIVKAAVHASFVAQAPARASRPGGPQPTPPRTGHR